MSRIAVQPTQRRNWTLTDRESRFAEEHIGIVWWYLNKRELPEDEWYDILVLRYLQAVKRWHQEPELQQYKFTTIAALAMRSAVSNEYRAQRRRPRTVSLWDMVPGTEELTYADIL